MASNKEEWLSLDEISKRLQCQGVEAIKLIRRNKLDTERPEFFKKEPDPKTRVDTRIMYRSDILPILADIRRGKFAIRPSDWLSQKQVYETLEINHRGGAEYSTRVLTFLMTIARQELGKEHQEKETKQFSDPTTGKMELCFSPAIVQALKDILKRYTEIPADWIDWEDLRLQGFSEKLIKKTQKVFPDEWDKKLVSENIRLRPSRVYSPKFIEALQTARTPATIPAEVLIAS